MTAELFTPGCMFKAGPMVSDAGEFWGDDDEAWAAWLDEVDVLIGYNDVWALLVSSPDGKVHVVDVLDGWHNRVRRLNGRAIRFIYPAERKAIDEVPS